MKKFTAVRQRQTDGVWDKAVSLLFSLDHFMREIKGRKRAACLPEREPRSVLTFTANNEIIFYFYFGWNVAILFRPW